MGYYSDPEHRLADQRNRELVRIADALEKLGAICERALTPAFSIEGTHPFSAGDPVTHRCADCGHLRHHPDHHDPE